MALIQVSCSHCSHSWDVSKAKKGGQVNCPACGVLVSLKGASDSKLFYGLVIGLFVILGLPLGMLAVMGWVNGNIESAVCFGSLFVVFCLALVISVTVS
tara:strand:- start:53 stop:349 length:297 start_codon:yes stop_codon:yes gene_type:complete